MSKMAMYKTYFKPVLMYASETWTYTKRIEIFQKKKIDSVMLVVFKCTIKPQILLKLFLCELPLIFPVNLKKKKK